MGEVVEPILGAVVMRGFGGVDKNDQPIFEGDTLKAYHSEYEEEIIATVHFENGTFTIGKYWKDGIHDWRSMEQYCQSDLEVFGNIHQHPPAS
ncbi:MAG: hypothetical protein GJ680_07580 [Alteromonadaceae bacterium]|nr:hypothetical protein [Alteromonadaceae bacterium]